MKKFSFLMFLLCCTFLLSAQQNEDFSKTEQAIVDVIKQETDGWWNRDYKKWSESWLHKPYISWSGTNNRGHQGYDSWEALSSFVQKSFEDYPDIDTAPVTRTNWEFRIYKNAAWVRFVQDGYGITKETRILEKKGGKWKLVHVGWINETSYEENETAAEK